MNDNPTRGLNLAQAVQSGRPFRLPGSKGWLRLEDGIIRLDDGAQYYHLEVDDFMRSDWEIEEPVITITRTDFLILAAQARLPYGEEPGMDPIQEYSRDLRILMFGE